MLQFNVTIIIIIILDVVFPFSEQAVIMPLTKFPSQWT